MCTRRSVRTGSPVTASPAPGSTGPGPAPTRPQSQATSPRTTSSSARTASTLASGVDRSRVHGSRPKANRGTVGSARKAPSCPHAAPASTARKTTGNCSPVAIQPRPRRGTPLIARQARSRDRRRQPPATSRTITSPANSSAATATRPASCRLQDGTEVSYDRRTSLTRRTALTSTPLRCSASCTGASCEGLSLSNQTWMREEFATRVPQCWNRSRSTSAADPPMLGASGSRPTTSRSRSAPFRPVPFT